MQESLTVLSAVVPVLGIIVIGLIIRKLDWLSEEADHSLLRVNINLLFPCLILDKALGNTALSNPGNLLLAPAVGFVTVAAGFAVGWACARFSGLAELKAKRTFAVTTGLYNYGYVPLPLSLMLFTGTETAGVLFVHNVGVELAMWTLGVMIFSGAGVGQSWKKFINAPLVAILLSLGLNAVGAADHIPKALLHGVSWLGQCAIPMSLILIGAVVADHLKDAHSDWGWRVIATASVVRLGLLPIGFLLLAKYLPASVELKRVIVLEAAMPAAVFPIVMSRHYGGDPPTALRVVLGTSVIGMVTIPLWIRFGMKFACS
jgi:malate permease and related proteins